jgi:hypothetical protein
MNPLSYVIKLAGAPVHCNDVASPPPGANWAINSTAATRKCHHSAMIPADDMQIESIRMSYKGLWKSIYRKKHLEEVTIFQESQGMSKEYLTETAKQAYGSRNKNGKWWLAKEAKPSQQ